jgi:homoserine dehydrogenase
MIKPLRIGLAGLGTVGIGVVGILQQQSELLRARAGREFELVAVSAKSQKKRTLDVSGYRFEPNPEALAALDIDVIVELMGGAEGPARALVEKSLANGKHVVTANKALIATHGAALARTAETHNVSLAFEAAVAGGIPVLKLLREGLAANNITRVMGILNGTCNYILTHMKADRRTFEDVLLEAQKLGYAEADPTFDVDGIDTAHKLAILTSLAYGTAPDLKNIHIEGIRSITIRDMEFASELGYAIKLLGIVSREGDSTLQRVYPCMVRKDIGLAHASGVFNAVQIDSSNAGEIFVQGRGAGGAPTASAVVADIIDIARGHVSPSFGVAAADLKPFPASAMDGLEISYYVRLGVIDKPGVLADITAIFRDSGISLKSFLQHGHSPGEKVYIVVVTHTTTERDMRAALAKMQGHASIMETPFCIRIEE